MEAAVPVLLVAVVIAAAVLAVRVLRRLFRRPRPPLIVDGSNVMHWKDETPSLDTLREVVQRLQDLGFAPGVVFDANAGYKLGGRYVGDRGFGRLLGLPDDHILVVPKGSPADPLVLTAARDMNARIVSNDRFRDWAADYPAETSRD
jgi:hypothetical protein